MRRLLAALLVAALPAGAVQPASCGALCGNWRLDAALSAAVAPAVDEALRSYSNPRARLPQRSRSVDPENTIEQLDAAMEQSIGPIFDRPGRADLRSELMSLLSPPSQLNLDTRGADFLIQGDKQLARKIAPGMPKARVDYNGTAKILASWKPGRLRISEKYDRKRQYFETYSLQAADGTLLVTREVQRPGMKPLRVQAVYRRG